MFIQDELFVPSFGKLRIEISEDGTFTTINDFSTNYEFIILIKSLDSLLISNIMYHHCPIGHDLWRYKDKLLFIKNIINKIHPGFLLEIYDTSMKNLLFSKNYHGVKNFRCLNLKSKNFDITYWSYYTFFYDTDFKQKCNIIDTDIVYDLGANIGAFSLYCSNFNVKKIYAFEPHPEVYSDLCFNLDKYGKNVEIFNKAILDQFKKVKLQNLDATVAASIKETGTLDVDAINLEKFVIDNNLELPTYLKIDIEGAEYAFFDNTSDSFFQNTRGVFFEFHHNDGNNVLKIIDRFKKMGYEIKHEPNALDENVSHMNTVYFNKL